MKKYTAIYCLAITCQLFIAFHGYSQPGGNGIEILQHPVFVPVCAGEGAALSVQARGSGLGYQWQVFKREGNYEDVQDMPGISGSQTAELHIASLSKSMNQYLYRCKISHGAQELFTRPAVVELKNASINFQPANGSGFVGDYHSIQLYATGADLNYQWQVDNGNGFTNIADDGTYQGSKTAILSIPEVAKKMEGYQYRCIVSGKSCEELSLVSGAASLTVSTAANPMKSMMGGDPTNVIWYMDGMTQAVTFFGNPNGVGVYVDGAVQVVNNSQITSQTGTGPSCDIKMTGHLYNGNTSSPLCTPGDISHFIFSAGDAQQIIGGNKVRNNFYKIKIDKASTTQAVTLMNDISFRKNLELANGDLALNGQKAYLDFVDISFIPQVLATGNAGDFPSIINETENNRILGAAGSVLMENQEVANSSPFVGGMNPGNIGAEIKDPSNFFAAKNITIERQHTTSANGGTNSIQRLYKISSSPDTPVPANMDFTFRYLDGDLGGANESALTIFKSDNNGTTWLAQTTDALNTAANFAKQNQVGDITAWWRLFPCLNVPVVSFTEGIEKHLCDGVAATIAPNITGGTPAAYSWTLNGTEVATTPTYSVTGVAGALNQTLILKVFNATGCFTSDTLTLIHEDDLNIDLGPDVTLCLFTSHTWNVTSPGVTNYLWKLNGNTVQNGPSGSYTFFANNPGGPYNLEVTASTAHCSATDNLTLTVDGLLVSLTGGLPIEACEPGSVSLDATPSSPGIPPYDYNWHNGASTSMVTFSYNSNDTYSVTVTDAFGCTASDVVSLFYSNMVLSQTPTHINCFGESTGAIDLTVTGIYGGTLDYLWSNGATTEDLAGLAAGTYTVTVTEYILLEVCTRTLSVTLTQPAAALALSGTVANVLCNGGNNGLIDLTVNGGIPPFTYDWGAGQPTTQDRSGLTAGTYNVTVTDANLCTKTASFTVGQPDVLTASTASPPLVTHVTCHGAGNGAISWTIIGGTTPYTFSWTGPGGFTTTDEDPTGLAGGTYNVTVTDAHNCTYTTSFMVNEPAALAATLTPANISCFGTSTGSIALVPSGGTPLYSFNWTGPGGYASTNEDISSLAAGAYNVTITDANACTLVPPTVTIAGPGALLEVMATTTNSTCFGNNNGSISLAVTGGWSPYTYLWEFPDGSFSSSQNISMLAPGDYLLQVIDANFCNYSNVLTVTEPGEIFLNPSISHISCFGENDGSIVLNVFGGTGAYTYNWQWSGGSSTESIIENLSGPTQSYSVTVTDASNCTNTAIYQVNEPDIISATAMVQNATCFGYNNGSIDLSPSGGYTADGWYSFSWTGPNGFTSTDEDISNLAPGNYSVSVYDWNACPPFTATYTISEPAQLTANPVITMPLECYGDTDGQLNANPSGGTPPYTYLWTFPNATTATTQFISNLSLPGTYSVEVNDSRGCATVPIAVTIELISPTEIITSGTVTDVTINGGNDGAIDLAATGGTGVLTFLWSNGQTTEHLSGLTAGTYTVTVTDQNNCTKTETFFVDEPDPLGIGVEVMNHVSCHGGNDGFIVTFGTGGVSPYDYNWSNGSTEQQLNNLAPGSYTLSLTDANGAEAIETFTITEPGPILPNGTQVNVTCNGATDGSIALTPSGGTPPFSYFWSNTSSVSSITGLAPGDYSVTITDDNFCEFLETFTITEPALLAASAMATDATCFGYNDGSIELTASGGTPPYSYNWNNGITTGSGTGTSIPTLYAAFYNITLTDDNGCTATISATINQPPPLNVNITGNQYLCDGESSILDAGPGFTGYDWSTGATTQTVSVNTPGIYTVTVSNASGCTGSGNAEIFVFPLPALTLNSAICDPDLMSYEVLVTSSTSNISADFGTVTDNGNGTFTISEIPTGQNVTITVSGGDPPCQNILVVTAPDCTCPTINPPVSNGNQAICLGETIPALTVTVGANETADWYDAPTGGNLLLAGNTGYAATAAGTFYVEARNTINNCTSTTRTALTLTINPLPLANAGSDVSICAGVNTQLNASGSTGSGTLTYLWSPAAGLSNANIANPVASPVATTTYTVLVTDANTCTASDEVTVTVNPLPTANAGADVAVCAGANTQLDASGSSGNGPLTYLWSPATGLNNPNIADPVASPTATTTYTVLVTDGNGCTATDAVLVTVNPLPSLTLNTTTCAPDLLSYEVLVTSNAGQLTADFGTVTDNGNGTFTITGVPAGQNVTLTATLTATGCQKTLVVTAPACACPVVNLPVSNGNQAICLGETIPALTVNVGTDETADWYDAPTGGNLLLSGNTSYTPTSAGTFYAEARNTINGCVSTARTAIMLTINPLPIANAGSDVEICAGANTQLNASGSSGSGTLTYLWSPATGLSNANIANPVASPVATTTYTVLVTDANTCTASDEVTVTVNPLPALTVNSADCAPNLLTYSVLLTTNGNNVTATAGTVTNNGGGNFTINGVPAGQNVTVTATISATGCQASQLVIAPDCSCPAVAAPVSGGNQTICAGNPVPALAVTVAANETADWYSAPTGGSLLQQGNTSYTPTGAGTFYAEARNTINNCISSSRTAVVLTINPLPVANAGPNVALCFGANTTLDASGSSGSGSLTYLWSPAASLGDPNIANPVASPTATTTYTVLVTDGNGCTATGQVTATVNPLPTLTVGAIVCAPNLLTYSVSLTSNGTVTASHGSVTNNGGGNFTISGVPTGQNVTVTAAFPATGCQRMETVVSPLCPCPVVNSPVSGGNQTICGGSPISALTVTVGANQTADWYDVAAGGTLLLSGNTSYTPTGAGTFYAEARNTVNQCVSATRTALVLTINPLPTANAGADVAICPGGLAFLNGSSSTGSGTLSYLWSPPTNLVNPFIANPAAFPPITTTYTLRVTDGNGCTATDQVTVTVNPLPVITILNTECAVDLLTYQVDLAITGDTVSANFGTVTITSGGLFSITDIPEGQNIVVTATVTATGCQQTQSVNAPDCSCPTVNAPVSGGPVEICTGTAIPALAVSVGAGLTADWYDAASGGNLLGQGETNFTPTGAGTFYAEARDPANGCTSNTRTAVVLTINPLPTANAGADVAICAGSATALNAGGSSGSGPLTYQWTPSTGLSDPNIANPVASPADTTTYTVLVTDENGCMASDGVVVAVNGLPLANAGADVALCFGENTMLDAGGSTGNGTLSFAWSPAVGLNDPNIPGPIASPDTTTNYTVTVTDGNGCTATDGAIVTVHDLPLATAGADDEICTGGSTVLDAGGSSGNGVLSFEWSPATGLSATDIANPVASPFATTTYTVEVTDGNGCVASDQVALTVNHFPTANAGADVAICTGGSTALNAGGSTGSGTLTYLWTPATGLNNPNIANPVSSPAATTTYTVLVTDGNGCTASDEVTVTVNPLPALTVITVDCAPNLLTYSVLLTTNGNTVTATAGTVTNNGGGNFTISGVPAGQNVTVTATISATGCQASQLVLAQDCSCPVIAAPVSGGNQTVCGGNPVPALAVSVAANETADWYSAPTGGSLLQQGNTSYTPTGAGTFYAEARNTINNCISSSRTAVVLTINPLPVANAGPNVALCFGTNTTLDASGSSGSGSLTYLWSPAASLSDPNIANPVASPAATTTYTVLVTDGNGCTATGQVTATVNPLPTLTVGAIVCAPNLLTYSVSLTSNGTVTASHGSVTNNGGGNFTISGVPTGQNVTVTAAFPATGCQRMETVVSPLCPCPVVNSPVSGGNQTICFGETIPALSVTVGANQTADWYDAASGGMLLLEGEINFTPSGAGTFYAEARNTINNCVSSTRTAVVLTINPLPAANAGADVAICFGTNTTLNAGGSTGTSPLSFSWTPATGLNNPNIANPVASPATTTTYTVIITDGNGCISSDEVVVTVNNLPVANAGADVAVCLGGSTVLNAGNSTGSGTLTYAWGPGTGLSATNIAAPTASPLATTTYTVTVTDGNGCSAADQVLVTVNPLPVITVNNVQCDNNLLEYAVLVTTNADVVTATHGTVFHISGGSYVVTNVPNGQDITITAAFSATGCQVQQGVNAPDCSCPPVNPPVSGGNQAICVGQPIPALSVTVGPGETAAWFDSPTGGLLFISGVTSFAPNSAGTFWVEAVNTNSNCTSATRTPVTLTIHPLPVANAGPDVTTCSGMGVQLAAGGSTGSGGLVFSWSPSTGLSNPNIVNPIANPAATTTYTVVATDGTGCSATDQVLVSVGSLPTLAVNVPACSADLLTYEVGMVTNGDIVTASAGSVANNGGGSYSISGIPSGQDVLLTITTTATGCVLSYLVTAPDCDCPVVAAPVSNVDEEICEGGTIPALAVTVNAGETVDWYDAPTGGDLILQNSNSYTPTAAGTFYAEARIVTSGCTSDARTAVTLTVHPLPIISFPGPPVVCAGSLPVVLSGSPTGGAFSGPGVSGNQFDPVAAGAGVHVLTYTYTDGNGCTDEAAQEVEVFALPSVLAGSNSPVCDGDDLLLTESGGNAVSWAWTGPDGFVSNEQNATVSNPTLINTGIYEVVVTSAAGCTNSVSTDVSLNPALGLSLSPDPAAFCPGGTVQLVATASGGTGFFDYAWTGPSGNDIGQVVFANETGNWSVTVTDGNGCTIAGSLAVSELPAMAVSFTSTDASCIGSDGTLMANVTGGLVPYTYEWDGFPDTTNLLTGIPAGSYQVIVTDGAGCVSVAFGNIGNSGAPVVSLENLVDVACAGAATGSISISVAGGSMPYLFNWSNGDMTQNINGLMAGNYGLEVTDILGCIVNAVFQVSGPPALAGVMVITQTTTPFTGNGAIDLTVMGGTPPYQYIWSNGLNSEDISNLFIGPYSVTITDANGCSVVESTTVTAVGALAVQLIGQNISCNGGSDGSVTVNISGGFMPYTILWSTGSNMPTISDLLPGNYQVTVTGGNGNTATGSINLTQPPLLQSFTQMTNNVCNGGSAGTANVLPSGGTAPYTYLWSNGATTQAVTGLLAGNFAVTVTDNKGCTNEKFVTIGEPPAMQIGIDAVTDNDCFGGIHGAVDISVSGGTFPYFANWSNGASTQDISGLEAGTYMVTISDFLACTATASVDVGQSPQIVISFDNTGVTCFGEADGSLTANVSGGTPGAMGYQFDWTNGGTAATIGNLVSGNYFVTVTDELGCTSVSNDFVAQPGLLLANLTVQNITCFGLANGTASVQPTGGTVPYSYLWNNAVVDSFLPGLDIGNYSVVVTDANGCSTTEATQITQPDLLTATATVTDLNCFNDFSGAIDLTVSGGTPPPFGEYIITWSSGEFTEDIGPLAAGDYSVIVADDNGCIVEDTFTVEQPDIVAVVEEINGVSCYGGNDGSIILYVNGGNAPYMFNWQNGATAPEITGLSVGDYTNTVTDNHGCVVSNSFEMTQPDILSMEYQVQRAGCSASDDGGIDLTVGGGVPGYTFNWSNGAVTEDISQLTAGNYAVTVTDGNGCTVSQSLGVANTPGTFEAYFLAASGLFDVDSVEVNSDDIIQFVDVSFPAPVSWQWFFGDPDSTTSDIANPSFSYPNDESAPQSSYMATLVASNLFCTDTMTKRIWITNNMRLIAPKEDSLVYLTFTNVLAYPNPTSGLVTLDIELSKEEPVSLYMVDMLGKILEWREMEGEDRYETKLDFTGRTPGMYFIQLRAVNQVRTVKVVVTD